MIIIEITSLLASNIIIAADAPILKEWIRDEENLVLQVGIIQAIIFPWNTPKFVLDYSHISIKSNLIGLYCDAFQSRFLEYVGLDVQQVKIDLTFVLPSYISFDKRCFTNWWISQHNYFANNWLHWWSSLV